MLNSFMITGAVSNGMQALKPLYWFFGFCMQGLLSLFNNQYFLALVVFTVITRVVLFPLTLRQQKTMAKTTRLQPKIQKIQKKYANTNDPRDRQKMNEEMQALYAREGHNPMNMGCGPMAFQMVFLMGIIGIIYYPVQYLLGVKFDNETSQAIVESIRPILNELGINPDKRYYFQLDLIQHFDLYKDVLMSQYGDIFTADKVASIEEYRSHMVFAGIDMTAIPHWKDGVIVLVPILCLVTSLGSSLMSTFIQKKTNPAAAAQQGQMLMMMLMMPFVSFWFSFQVPAAVGFYWIVSNLVALVQQAVMAKFFPPKRNMARSMIEDTIQRRAREASIKKIKD